jgi:hypothetical protein
MNFFKLSIFRLSTSFLFFMLRSSWTNFMNQTTIDASDVNQRHNERFSTQHLSLKRATSTSDDLLAAFSKLAPVVQSRNVPSLQPESNCSRNVVTGARYPSDSHIKDDRCEASSNWSSDNHGSFSRKQAPASKVNDELSTVCLKFASNGAEWYSDDQFPAAGGFNMSDYVAGYQAESFSGAPRAAAPALAPAIERNALHHQQWCEDTVTRRSDDCFYETCHDNDMPLSLCTRSRDNMSSSNDVEQMDTNEVASDVNSNNNNNSNRNYYAHCSRNNVIQRSDATVSGGPSNQCRVSYGAWDCYSAGNDNFAEQNPPTHVDLNTRIRIDRRQFVEASSSSSHATQRQLANDYDVRGRTCDEPHHGAHVNEQTSASLIPRNVGDLNEIPRIKMSEIPGYAQSKANLMNASKVDEATVSSTDSRFESHSPTADSKSSTENGSMAGYALSHDDYNSTGCTSLGGLSCMPLKCRFKNTGKDYSSSGRHYV